MTARLRTRAQVRQWLACLDAAAALTAPLAAALFENGAAAADALSAAGADALVLADNLYVGLRARMAMRQRPKAVVKPAARAALPSPYDTLEAKERKPPAVHPATRTRNP